jgi:hypothetical protein
MFFRLYLRTWSLYYGVSFSLRLESVFFPVEMVTLVLRTVLERNFFFPGFTIITKNIVGLEASRWL